MASCLETITSERCVDLLRFLEGMKVTRTWQGYGVTIFLEIGKLTRTKTKIRVRGVMRTHTSIIGQVTMMIDPDWRIERPRSIQFASSFKEKAFKQHFRSLVGVKIASVELVGRLPELRVNFADGRLLATFSDRSAQPAWSIGIKDLRLFPMNEVWRGVDVSPWVRVFAGQPVIDYCFDPTGTDARKLFAMYWFPWLKRGVRPFPWLKKRVPKAARNPESKTQNPESRRS